jgi:hypothetical protein
MLKACTPQREKYTTITTWPSHFVHLEKNSAVAVSFEISGSGAQALTKGLLNCMLWTLTTPTFPLKSLCSTTSYPVVSATVNRDVYAPFPLLEPAVRKKDGSDDCKHSKQKTSNMKQRRPAKQKPAAKELVFRIIQKGTAHHHWRAHHPYIVYKIDWK